MKITSQEALNNIVDDNYYQKVINVLPEKDIALDELFSVLEKQVDNKQFMHIELNIGDGINDLDTKLILETNIINLPLRYVNQLKKIILPENQENVVNLYMIVESPYVSKSSLVIKIASTVAAFIDDPDSVKNKISQWFTDQLEKIAEVEKNSEQKE